MVARISRPFSTALRGVLAAIGARWRLFIAVALGVFFLDILVPPLVLAVIPVVGLAFVGLSSTPLKWMADLSAVGTSVVLGALVLGVAYLGWRVGAAARPVTR